MENSEAWKGKVRYSLGPQHPAGTTLDSQTGELAWTPPPDQAAGNYDFAIFAEASDGRHDETTLRVTVTAPVPLKLKPIPPHTVEAGKPLQLAVTPENPDAWQGKVHYAIASPAFPARADRPAVGPVFLDAAAGPSCGAAENQRFRHRPGGSNDRDRFHDHRDAANPCPSPCQVGGQRNLRGPRRRREAGDGPDSRGRVPDGLARFGQGRHRRREAAAPGADHQAVLPGQVSGDAGAVGSRDGQQPKPLSRDRRTRWRR